MHDTNPNKEERMPPLIVVGLTGPVGSGCSVVSNLIFEGKRLLRILTHLGWIDLEKTGGFTISWEKLNQDVDKQYEKLSVVTRFIKEYKEFIKEYEENKSQAGIDNLRTLRSKIEKEFSDEFSEEAVGDFLKKLLQIKKDITKKLKETLEVREEIKALDKLKAYYKREYDLFCTISASTEIVLYALMSIEQDDFSLRHIKTTKRMENCKKFVEIAKNKMNRRKANTAFKKADTKGYKIYYENCRDWKNKDKEKDKDKSNCRNQIRNEKICCNKVKRKKSN